VHSATNPTTTAQGTYAPVATMSDETDQNIAAAEDEDLERAQANLNSPKRGPGPLTFNDDDAETPDNGMGMTLHMEEDDDEETDANKMTPNTERDVYGINSPRKPGAMPRQAFNEDAGSDPGLAGLVTQVQRPDPNQSLDDDGRDSLDETQNDLQKTTESGGICACFSCLFSCCSGPQPPEDVPMTSQNEQNTETNKPDQSLLSPVTNGISAEAKQSEREDSVSSTEYSGNLLPPLSPENKGKKCLVLDLDETLVHSSFKPIPKPDFIIPVEIDRVVHHVYVLKRPYVDEFLLRASKCYEIVIFTASLSKYADPLLDKLDIHNVIEHRLFRESCVIHGTAYVKDMRRLRRKLKDTIIVDNSPPSYMFQPCNAVPIASWFDDQNDTQLLDFCPVIETTMKDIGDVRKLLDANNKSFRWLCNQAHQPLSKYTVRNDKANRN